MPDDFNDLLNFDPLNEAERVTGESYSNDKFTSALGFAMHLKHVEDVRDQLFLRDDTYYSMPFADTIRILEELGFELIYERTYNGFGGDIERQIVWWRKGVLALIDSYHSDMLNSGKIYYCWEPNQEIVDAKPDEPGIWEFISSGGYDPDEHDLGHIVWVGDHDLREALRHNLERLESNGKFLEVWTKKPFLWFPTFEEEHQEGYDYKQINWAVEGQFPPLIIAAINGVTQ